MSREVGTWMRVIHRYLGFFLAGIMAMYAVSGIVMIFRNTDFLKKEIVIEQNIGPNVTAAELPAKLKNKKLIVDRAEGSIMYFKEGSYNVQTGKVIVTQKKLPFVLDKMTHLHKSTSADPLYFLNIFFGLALLFFVISSFWMFIPSSSVFRKGMYFTLAGILLTLLLVLI